MTRAECISHRGAYRSVLFVVVFSTATLMASPRNTDWNNNLQSRMSYLRAISTPGRRTIAQTVDEKPEQKRDEASVGVENSKDFEQETRETDNTTDEPRETNSTLCALTFIKKYPKICDVATKIFEVQTLLTRLDLVVMRRMGSRQFNFVCLTAVSKSATEQLDGAVGCLTTTISKVLKFLGTTERISESTASILSRLAVPPIIGLYPERAMNQSSSWWRRRRKQWKNQVAANVNQPNIHEEANPGSTENCAADIVQIDTTVCATLAKMDILDNILKNSYDLIVKENFYQEYGMPIKLDSNNLELGSFLEAIRESLFNYGGTALDAEAIAAAWRDANSRDKSSSRGMRNMAKGNEVAEIFQTLNFRIDFVPRNDHRSFGNTLGYWNDNNLVDNRNEKPAARRITTAKYRSDGFNGENFSSASRRGQGAVPKRNTRTKMTKTTPWRTHSSGRLDENWPPHNVHSEQEDSKKRSTHRRRISQGGSRLPAVTTMPIDKYPSYRDGEATTEDSKNATNKGEQQCSNIEDHEKNLHWKEWLISKVREFAKKAVHLKK